MTSKLGAATLLAVAVAVSSLISCSNSADVAAFSGEIPTEGLDKMQDSSKSPPPLILVVGDSLTRQSSDEIEARGEARGYRVIVSSFAGATVQDSNDNTRDLIEEHQPDAVVVALGTNNASDPNFPGFSRLATQDPFNIQVANMLTITSAAECSLWVEPTETPARSSTAELTKAKLDTLRALVAPAERIAWNDKQAQEPSPGAWLQPDGIHLTPAGEVIYANTIIDNTIRMCGI